VLYLWVFPASRYPAWPHFLLLSFYIFVIIALGAIIASLTTRREAPAVLVAAPGRPGRRVRLLWIALTAVMIILYILFNGFSAAAQSWIGYPGDYAIWLGNQVQNRRTERGTFFPPFWKLDNHYVLIDFHKSFELLSEDDVLLQAEGRYNCKLDGKMLSGSPQRLHLSAGRHTLEIKVYNQMTPPVLRIEGRYLHTDAGWDVTFEDKEWIDASGKASDKSGTVWVPAEELPGDDPAHWHLAVESHSAITMERTTHGMLVDFGKESFGYIDLLGLRGSGGLSLYYGESREEALSVDSCEVLDRMDIDVSQSRDSVLTGSRAFRFVNIQWTGNIRLDSVSMLFEYAPLAQRGSFRCSDPAVNRIWDVAAYTFHLNTREFFIDGIKRDRWIWSGDACQSYLMNYYLFFDSATVKRTLWALRGKDPVTGHINTIMDYSFYWFTGIYDYYRYTGDSGFIKLCYPRMVSLMNWIQGRRDPDGWLQGLPGDWLFIDWADGLTKKGELSFEQLLFVRSLETMTVCAGIAGDSAREGSYRRLAGELHARLFSDFWDPARQVFVHDRIDGVRGRDVRRYTNMFGIFFGYLDSTQRVSVKRNVLLNDSIQQITTPYMQFFELEALCAMGQQKQVLQRIKTYWGGMLSLGATSFWEKYDPAEKGAAQYAMYGRPFGKSLCHAWGASPIYLLGKYYLGVRPLSPGYASYAVEPVLGGLEWMKGEVPTPHGNIKLYCSRSRMRVHAVAGEGALRFSSRTRPMCKEAVIRVVGGHAYEITLDPNKDYTITYAAMD
jgi:hypothetical protein